MDGAARLPFRLWRIIHQSTIVIPKQFCLIPGEWNQAVSLGPPAFWTGLPASNRFM